MESVADLLLIPPTQEKYESLIKALLERNRDSEERRLDALLSRVELGDQTPSELYRAMESLANSNDLVNPSLLKGLNKLPPSLRTCLMAVENSQSQEELFRLADRIHDCSSKFQVSQAHIQQSSRHDENIYTELLQRIQRLEISRGDYIYISLTNQFNLECDIECIEPFSPPFGL